MVVNKRFNTEELEGHGGHGARNRWRADSLTRLACESNLGQALVRKRDGGGWGKDFTAEDAEPAEETDFCASRGMGAIRRWFRVAGQAVEASANWRSSVARAGVRAVRRA
jgi:hypothetical protein